MPDLAPDLPPDLDVLYLTNRAALVAKYGTDGAAAVLAALDDLVAADAERGLTAHVGRLDEPADSIVAVRDVGDDVTTKVAVDEWFASTDPDYLVLVGGIDIVCMQPLVNPMPSADVDPDVPSDLPYACAGAPSRTVSRWLGPDRVVGRLPDTTGEADLELFLTVIDAAARPTAIARPGADSTLAVSAERWAPAGRAMLAIGTLGEVALHTSPTEGPHWSAGELACELHALSLHGASRRPTFWGEDPAGDKPVAHRADLLTGTLAPGTVCVTGCCYGAEPYEPRLAGGTRPMWSAYLGQRASGYIGSTTIAYGADTEAYGCDELCGYVLASLCRGGSLGRSLLEARQRFVEANPVLGPEQQKTLAQFVLYGHPAHHPWTRGADDPDERRVQRRSIRAGLRTAAMQLQLATTPAIRRPGVSARGGDAGGTLTDALGDLATNVLADAGFGDADVASYSVSPLASPVVQSRSFLAADGALAGIDLPPLDDAPRVTAMTVAVRQVADDGWDGGVHYEGLRVSERSDGTVEARQFSSR